MNAVHHSIVSKLVPLDTCVGSADNLIAMSATNPKTRPPIRVVIADDHPIVGNAVRQTLERQREVTIIAMVHTVRELLELLETTQCDLIVTDFSMPASDTVDGLPLIANIRRRWPDLEIIVLTMIANPAVLQSILDLGVKGLINKSDALSELALAINVVARKQTYVSQATRDLLDRAGIRSIAIAMLSPRETEVLRLFASGKTVTEIARHLNRSVKTISTQKLEAMAKLGLKSDLEIYSYARDNGLLS